MGAVRVDPERQRAWVQGGALLGALDAATQQYGLADDGRQRLAHRRRRAHPGRRDGLAGPAVRAWPATTCCRSRWSLRPARSSAPGESENPELFWGLRGGGGNFGVVTEFEFRLHDTGTRTLAVELDFPVDQAARRPGALAGPSPGRHRAGDVHGRDRGGVATLGFVWVGDPDAGREHARTLGRPRRPGRAARGRAVVRRPPAPRRQPAGPRAAAVHEGPLLPRAARRRRSRRWSRHDPSTGAGCRRTAGRSVTCPRTHRVQPPRDRLRVRAARTGWTDPAEDAARIGDGPGVRRGAGAVRVRGLRQRARRRRGRPAYAGPTRRRCWPG